jgi:hypothetical protein
MASKKSSQNVLVTISVVLSLLLTGYYVYGILQLVQNLRSGMVGSPSVYALVPAGLLAIYVAYSAKKQWEKYYAVIVITVLLMGLLVWFLGVTGAGSFLV